MRCPWQVFDIHTKDLTDKHGNINGIAYHVDADFQGLLYQANFWVHAVVIKLLPCSILTVISIWLIRALYSANQHQKNLRNYSACPSAEKTVKRQHKADKRTDRTTKMLLAVLLLFLVTELPQGILGLMSGLLGWCFFKRCYDLFGELMDFLALLNGAINFVLYCSMSRQFRQTFRQMALQPRLARWLPPQVSHSDSHNQNTYVFVFVLLSVSNGSMPSLTLHRVCHAAWSKIFVLPVIRSQRIPTYSFICICINALNNLLFVILSALLISFYSFSLRVDTYLIELCKKFPPSRCTEKVKR